MSFKPVQPHINFEPQHFGWLLTLVKIGFHARQKPFLLWGNFKEWSDRGKIFFGILFPTVFLLAQASSQSMQHLYFCAIPLLIKDYLSTFHLRLFCNIWCNWIHMWFTCVIFPFTGVSTYLSLRKRFFWFRCGFFEAALWILSWEKVHIQNNGKSIKNHALIELNKLDLTE